MFSIEFENLFSAALGECDASPILGFSGRGLFYYSIFLKTATTVEEGIQRFVVWYCNEFKLI